MNLVTQAVWSGSNRAVHAPREVTRIARANGKDEDQPADSIHASLHPVTFFFVICFVYLKRLFAERMTKQDSGQSANYCS